MRAVARLLSAIAILAGLYVTYKCLLQLPTLKTRLDKFAFTVPGHGDLYAGKNDPYTQLQPAKPTSSSKATASLSDKADIASSTQPSISVSTPQIPTSSPVIDRIVVIGRTDTEDTAWVEQLRPSWDNAVYWVNNRSQPLHTPMNKGREANAYLTYIVENYDRLPSTIAFVHPHEEGYPQAWHTDAVSYSNVASLRSLQIDHVQRNGYANLRCIAVPGCPDEIQPFREQYEEHRTAEHAFPEAWKYIFENDNVPNVVGTPCCAQFAVSRNQVLKRPLAFYTRALRWLQETPVDDYTSGRVFEYMWHIIFGQEPVYCPSLEQCYREVYGRKYA